MEKTDSTITDDMLGPSVPASSEEEQDEEISQRRGRGRSVRRAGDGHGTAAGDVTWLGEEVVAAHTRSHDHDHDHDENGSIGLVSEPSLSLHSLSSRLFQSTSSFVPSEFPLLDQMFGKPCSLFGADSSFRIPLTQDGEATPKAGSRVLPVVAEEDEEEEDDQEENEASSEDDDDDDDAEDDDESSSEDEDEEDIDPEVLLARALRSAQAQSKPVVADVESRESEDKGQTDGEEEDVWVLDPEAKAREEKRKRER